MPSYLVHFNRLHDKLGRFTYGDGDGDGQVNNKSSDRYNKNTGLHRINSGTGRRYRGDSNINAAVAGSRVRNTDMGNSLSDNKRMVGRPGHDWTVKAGRRTPPKHTPGKNEKDNGSDSTSRWDSRRGSNINVVGGSSKGYSSSLSSEQIEDYRVAGQSWVVDKLDEITDPEWWKEQEKKARVQLGLYVKGDKTVSGKSHEVTPKATKVTKSTPKKQEKQKTR